MKVLNTALFLIASGASFLTPLVGQPVECSAIVSDSKKASIVDYVRKKYDVPKSVNLTLQKVSSLHGTCYRQLTVEAKTNLSTSELTLYLSPDERFLIGELFDTLVDPLEEERQKDKELMSGFTRGNIPTVGRADAPVTIVEFADFQCPFCRTLKAILADVQQSEKNDIRIVFHHFPLPNHAWARIAAEGAACAQLQNNESFWAMYQKIFDDQKWITVENIKQKLQQYAADDRLLDMKAFNSCLDNDLSLGLVYQDLKLGTAANVTGTPTLFINGRLTPSVSNANELCERIRQAKLRTKADEASIVRPDLSNVTKESER